MDRLARHSRGTIATTTSTVERLSGYLRGLEEIYHSEMGEEELAIYLESLRQFPLSEIKAAAARLMVQPPDGWTGMPKLPDFIRAIHELRSERAEQSRVNGTKELAFEHCEVCKGSGWEIVKTSMGNTAARRCRCWLRARKALGMAENA
jgi:hypothetical protein